MIMYVCLALLAVLVALALIMGIQLIRTLKRYRITKHYTAALGAPSVSVCIPARNEKHALADCLERVLASTYPKLEVIVYDDESQDETPTIIKSFAHEGVRFVSGGVLPEGWLGRNYALHTLAGEASGTFIVFMDVDTIVQPATIGGLVGFAMTESVDMVSVLPRREDSGRASVLFGTLRYFWQLVGLPFNRAAASSSAWLIKRDILLERGGLEDIKGSFEPESVIARSLGSSYRYIVGTLEFGVGFEKKWRSQIDTGRRLLFPLFGMKGFLFLAFLNAPTGIFVVSLLCGWNVVTVAAMAVLLMFIGIYAVYLKVAWARNWFLGALMWPYVVLQEFIVMIMSAWGYARGSVAWKHRAVFKED